MSITLDDLWEVPDDSDLPPLDRAGTVAKSDLQQEWIDHGRVILPGLLPDDLIEAYCAAWQPEFAHDAIVYMHCPEARALCLYDPLVDVIEELIGEPMGLHLDLAGWVSTERDWHQDDYLNPPIINGHYLAVWMALDDIHPDSGPFQYIDGSHTWPIIRREKMLRALDEPLPYGRDDAWPSRSETLLSPLFEERFEQLGLTPTSYIPKKGDVLVWHSRLTHRGSKANVPGMERKALIAHYSALSRRVDMPNRAQQGRGHYFVLGSGTRLR